MKINQWTLGLAAIGVVSLASAVNAEEAKMNPLQTALSATTLSGYVDTSVNWTSIDDGKGGFPPASAIPYSANKSEGFNLNVVKLSLEKALDESEWASGYKVDLLFGPDAQEYNAFSGGDVAIKQAYVALRTPVGNGIDWKMGVFDSIIGYETFDRGNNPNFTHSYGYSIEPTRLTGMVGTYRISETVAVAAGMANSTQAAINSSSSDTWEMAWMASVAVTAPQDMGFLSGSTLYGGAILGDQQDNYYVGATMNTPVTGLKAGIAFDYATDLYGSPGNDGMTLAGYLSYQCSEKLSLHARAEVGNYDNLVGFNVSPPSVVSVTDATVIGLTGTVQYDLWQNVVSRVEIRWDQWDHSGTVPANPEDTVGIYANLIYKF